ncbi:uncharacterized protein I303_106290 [Kwoniella dejecticola CBS 10117]|uniref:Uncharacterized protein n=1 Tax=Kwoniella dejecticola CBS 10117 TaxID=1296121 RepID=A0A1A6A1T4_9TREE|nr:uncharacterized protein I303_06310 [Kwoniella dejecticola CBS 10117]OBR84023.1 hypothetical protein I303_06310 [Kwoniella dejecticola CBS 10117]
MSYLQDRSTPRALTFAELRVSWGCIVDPEKERQVITTLQEDDLLPNEANGAIPFTLKDKGTNFRAVRVCIMRNIFNNIQLPVGTPQFGIVVPQWLQDRPTLASFDDHHVKAQQIKEIGNHLFRRGKFEESLGAYAEAWGALLPYHIHAFASEDMRVLLYGNCEAKIFNNMVIALMEWSRTDAQLAPVSKIALLKLALSCGQIVTDPAQAATLDVGTMFKASRRMIEIATKLQGSSQIAINGHYALDHRSLEHYRFFVEKLKDAPKDKLLFEWDGSLQDKFVHLANSRVV